MAYNENNKVRIKDLKTLIQAMELPALKKFIDAGFYIDSNGDLCQQTTNNTTKIAKDDTLQSLLTTTTGIKTSLDNLLTQLS